MATCVSCGHASVRHASSISGTLRPPLPSFSRLFNDDLCLLERLTPPLGSCALRPISNHKIRMFVRELMHAEVNRA
jgi:hypothetical protein